MLDDDDDGLPNPDELDGPQDPTEVEDAEEAGTEDAGEGGEQDGEQGAQAGDAGRVEAGSGHRSANETIRELRRQRQEFQRELEAIKAERVAQQQHRQADPYAQQQAAALEQERLSLMDPEARFNYLRSQDQQRFQGELQRIRFEMHDTQDQARFETLKATNPVVAKYAPEVESRVAAERAKGLTVSRDTVLKFLIGEAVLKKAGSTATRQRKQATERVGSQQTAPRNPGGMPREGRAAGDDMASLARRLKDVQI